MLIKLKEFYYLVVYVWVISIDKIWWYSWRSDDEVGNND